METTKLSITGKIEEILSNLEIFKQWLFNLDKDLKNKLDPRSLQAVFDNIKTELKYIQEITKKKIDPNTPWSNVQLDDIQCLSTLRTIEKLVIHHKIHTAYYVHLGCAFHWFNIDIVYEEIGSAKNILKTLLTEEEMHIFKKLVKRKTLDDILYEELILGYELIQKAYNKRVKLCKNPENDINKYLLCFAGLYMLVAGLAGIRFCTPPEYEDEEKTRRT